MRTKNERLVYLRKHLGMSQSEFAKTILLSQSQLCMIEKGDRELTERTIKVICMKFNVNYDWIQTGEGDMLTDVGDAQAIVDAIMMGENEFAKKVFVTLAQMSKEEWKVVERLLKALAEE